MKGIEADPKSSNCAENESSFATGAVKASVAVSVPMTADKEFECVIGEWRNLDAAMRSGPVVIVRAARRD
jgi:hypothetical protein